MKSISRWLVPGFLQRLDQYLRERYPVLWYSGAHWVLFYGFVGGVVLFGAGMLYPVHWVKDGWVNREKFMNLDHWVVDPIKPIEFAYDNLYIYPLVFVLAFSLFWVYRQFQLKPFFHKTQHSLLCLLIYVGCCWVLSGGVATAFRMGTIVKTAWIWMPERDLQDFKNSGIYPYGFVMLPEDSLWLIPIDTLSFFQKREKVFKHIWKWEASWLKERYRPDTAYWIKLLDLADRSYLADRSFLANLPVLMYRSYLADRSYLLYLANRQDLAQLTYIPYRSERWERSEWEFLWELQPGESMLYTYYKLNKKRINHPKASAYSLNNFNDTMITHPLIIIPSLPNQIENAVRSVEHARQFLRESIFWRYFWHVFYYSFLIGALLFLLPWSSAQSLLQLGVMAIVGWFGLQFFEIKNWEWHNSIWKLVHIVVYLTLPTIGLILLFWMFWLQKQGQLFVIAVNMVFLGVLTVLLSALNFNGKGILAQFGSPINGAFYGAQMIGLLAACIVPYVQAMSKAK